MPLRFKVQFVAIADDGSALRLPKASSFYARSSGEC